MVRLRCGAASTAMRGLPVALLLAAWTPTGIASEPAATTPSLPGDADLEAQAARIGSVTIRIDPIFDPEKPGERKALYQLADRWHIDTRESSIEKQLLFQTGDPYSRRILDETERNLRHLRFIQEPVISAVAFHDGLVDLEVAVHDVWTTNPGLSFRRTGGENSTGIRLEELNVLGLGKQIAIAYHDNVDRSTYELGWHDPNVWGSRWQDTVTLTDSDDGAGESVELVRPFYSLDSRWTVGISYVHDDAIQDVYRLGESIAEYREDAHDADIHFGWSKGLRNGWTRRWYAGMRHEEARFSEVPDSTAPTTLPADRDLNYPFLRLEAIQDDFETAHDLNLISRTEDLYFGKHYSLELGWAATAYGSDRDAAVLRADASRGYRLGAGQSLFLGSWLSGRLEDGSLKDTLLSSRLRYYRQTSPRSKFFASLSGDLGHDLDADHELVLGGEEGLRGYPLRYQTGDTRALLTIEQRIYTRYSLWKLADIGGAVFFDMGRTWGESAFGPTLSQGMLKDIGVGLRLGSTRSALGNILHLDVAFPLDGDSSISSMQFLVQTKGSF
ncbi:MAG: hypothetical protein ACRER4_03090 [Steroidobacteraceae bacterium]